MTKIISPYAALAFDALYCKLKNLKSSENISLKKWKKVCNFDDLSEDSDSPLFVTWDTIDPKSANDQDLELEKELRGCIGNFGELPVEDGIKEYSLIASLEDPRFPPVKLKELKNLQCTVTLLKNFRKGKDKYDWTLGKNGIRISFHASSTSTRRLSATFLPDVASEQGWDKDETLKHLIRKAGGRLSNWNDYDIELTKYEGEKGSVTYDEYLTLRRKLLK